MVTYAECISEFMQNGENDIPTALECIGGESQTQDDQILTEVKAQSEFFDSSMKVMLLVYSSSLVFIMQAGFAMICSGCVRKKNVQNTILKNLLDICGSSIAFFFVGYAFAYGGEDPNKKTFIGSSDFLLTGGASKDDTGIYYVFWWFQFSFAATAGKFNIFLLPVSKRNATDSQLTTSRLHFCFLIFGTIATIVAGKFIQIDTGN